MDKGFLDRAFISGRNISIEKSEIDEYMSNYVYLGQPYSLAISNLKKLQTIKSPMAKLEWVYTCCTEDIKKEVSAFWNGYDISKDDLVIDADNLQGIIIYIISRLENPQIIAEVRFCQKYLPKGVLKSSRTHYLEMIGAACNYLLDLDVSQAKKKMKE